MGFEEKNATKYLATFPYPYMNGYLHLGKLQFQSLVQALKAPAMATLSQLLYRFVVFNFCLIQFFACRSRILHV